MAEIVDLFADNEPSVEEADRGVYKGKEGVRRYFIDLLGNGREPAETRHIIHHVSTPGGRHAQPRRHIRHGKVVRHGHGGQTDSFSP